jgi:hypothetical protein
VAEDALRDRISIKSEIDSETYDFKIPSIKEQAQLGYRSASLRRKYDPDHVGALDGIDMATHLLITGCALFEQYLLTASQEWPFSRGDDGRPVVDHEKFPDDKDAVLREMAARYDAELARFRSGRRAVDAAPAQAVASS